MVGGGGWGKCLTWGNPKHPPRKVVGAELVIYKQIVLFTKPIDLQEFHEVAGAPPINHLPVLVEKGHRAAWVDLEKAPGGQARDKTSTGQP